MTSAEFIAAMPEFQNEPVPRVQAALAASASYVAIGEWSDLYTEALTNWVAHRIVTSRPAATAAAGAPNDATMKTVAAVSVQRDAGIIRAKMDNPYLTTQYGQRYLYLVRVRFGGTTVAA